MTNSFKVFIEKPYYTDIVQIWFVRYEGDKVLVAKPVKLEFEEQKEGDRRENPTLEIGRWHSQAFLEALKSAVEGKSVMTCEGELIATKKHLEDMRTLVFEELKHELESSK